MNLNLSSLKVISCMRMKLHNWKTYEGNAGFHVVTPLKLTNKKIILVNRGWVSEGYKDPQKRQFSLTPGQLVIKGIIRYPTKKRLFCSRK